MTKPTFDLLSLRTIRNDALIQYSSLNQSEPLRINLYFLLSCVLVSLPTILSTLDSPTAVPSIYLTVGCDVSAVLTSYLFYRECVNRSKQLNRIEREMNTEYLTVRLPSILGGAKDMSLKEFRSSSSSNSNGSKRILALAGSRAEIFQVLQEARVLRRRLVQSNCLLVILPTDVLNPNKDTWEWEKEDAALLSGRWIAEATNLDTWATYFADLAASTTTTTTTTDDGDNNNNNRSSSTLIWFGLNYNGRSFGSGIGMSSLNLFELMGSFLRPSTNIVLSREDAPDALSDSTLIDCQKAFYDALTSGDETSMKHMFAQDSGVVSEKVTRVIQSGGRVDGWTSCLADGARPSGMTIADSDAWTIGIDIGSSEEAYTTAIEFPVSEGSSLDADENTLLAVQKWTRKKDAAEWKLLLHQTIPWTAASKANGTLRCDVRGCVALTRSKERRTFGGLIG